MEFKVRVLVLGRSLVGRKDDIILDEVDFYLTFGLENYFFLIKFRKIYKII